MSQTNHIKVDSKVQEVRDALALVTGNDDAYDTLLEIKTFAESIVSTGAADIGAQIASEISAREAADNTLTTDLSSEISNREAAISAEYDARVAAVDTLTTALETNEISNREAAVDSLSSEFSTDLANEISNRQSAISSEEDARIAGDNSLESDLATEVSNREAAVSSEAGCSHC